MGQVWWGAGGALSLSEERLRQGLWRLGLLPPPDPSARGIWLGGRSGRLEDEEGGSLTPMGGGGEGEAEGCRRTARQSSRGPT